MDLVGLWRCSKSVCGKFVSVKFTVGLMATYQVVLPCGLQQLLFFVAQWRRSLGVGPATISPRMTLGKLFTHMCLCSPSSINWYRRKLGAKQAFHATHQPWTCSFVWCLAKGYGNGDQCRPVGPCVSARTLVVVRQLNWIWLVLLLYQGGNV